MSDEELRVDSLDDLPDPQASRIAELEAQVTRLQNAIRGCVNRLEPREARTVVEAHTKPGDLDPLDGEA